MGVELSIFSKARVHVPHVCPDSDGMEAMLGQEASRDFAGRTFSQEYQGCSTGRQEEVGGRVKRAFVWVMFAMRGLTG